MFAIKPTLIDDGDIQGLSTCDRHNFVLRNHTFHHNTLNFLDTVFEVNGKTTYVETRAFLQKKVGNAGFFSINRFITPFEYFLPRKY